MSERELIWRREGAVGVIRLNRPKTLNALTLDMVRGISSALDEFKADVNVGLVLLEGAGERGLCAGGDIRSLYLSAKSGGDLGKVFWREEYVVNSRIRSFPKPYVAFMDGIVMGGGVGLSAHASHRIVTDRTRLAMPEVGIGFFPDVGGTWLLSQAPGELGTYLGLTGETVAGSDVIAARCADAFVPAERLPELRETLTKLPANTTGEQVADTIRVFEGKPDSGLLSVNRHIIDRNFGFKTLEEIVASLLKDEAAFAQDALQAMRKKSPLAMKLTLELLRRGRPSAALEECLVREYRAALTAFTSHDFKEGIRAAVIDKDRNPKWRPEKIEDVSMDMLVPYFKARGTGELSFWSK